MTFAKYKVLARKVFPTLPSDFETMPDELKTYQVVFNFLCPKDIPDLSNLTDSERIDRFSVSNWTLTKLREGTTWKTNV